MPHISVATSDPAAFIKFVREVIRQGHARTWELDENDNLRHVGDNNRWRDSYAVQPSKSGQYAAFHLFATKSSAPDRDAGGVIMGALLSFIIRHCISTKGMPFYETIFYQDN